MQHDTRRPRSYQLQKCSRPLGLAKGGTTSIAGYGELTVAFRSDDGWVYVKLHDVAYASLMSYLILLPSLALKGYTYACNKVGVALKLRGGIPYILPLIGKLCRQYGYHPEMKGRLVDTGYAVIAPEQAKAPTTHTDIKTFHCTYGHTHEVLFKKPAEQQGVTSGNSTSAGGVQWRRGYGSPSPSRRISEQIKC